MYIKIQHTTFRGQDLPPSLGCLLTKRILLRNNYVHCDVTQIGVELVNTTCFKKFLTKYV